MLDYDHTSSIEDEFCRSTYTGADFQDSKVWFGDCQRAHKIAKTKAYGIVNFGQDIVSHKKIKRIDIPCEPALGIFENPHNSCCH